MAVMVSSYMMMEIMYMSFQELIKCSYLSDSMV